MARAIAAAARVRCITSPNPWVGAVLRSAGGELFEGALSAAKGLVLPENRYHPA